MTRHPITDVIVVIPGIMGSTLYRGNTPVWEPSVGAITRALASLFQSLTSLRLPENIGDSGPEDGIRPVGLMPDLRLPFGLWTFDLGYSRLLEFLRTNFDLVEAGPGDPHTPSNLVVFPYDWRLSNRHNGERLRDRVVAVLKQWRSRGGPCAEAKLVFICHSMGGLVARWFIDVLGGAPLTRKLVTLGTPHRGALEALDQLVNGVRKGPGRFKLNLTGFARSLPSLHQLLPAYACVEAGEGLATTTEIELPDLDADMVRDARRFHDQLDEARRTCADAYALHPIVGFRQPTWTTGRLAEGRIERLRTIRSPQPDGTSLAMDEGGDATVPRLSAAPRDIPPDSPILKYAATNHVGLVHSQAVFDELEGILTARPAIQRAEEAPLAVEMEEVLDPEEPLAVRAALPEGQNHALEAVIRNQHGAILDIVRLRGTAQAQTASIPLPQPGVFQVTIRGAGASGRSVQAITTSVLSWPPEALFDAAAQHEN